jgi:plastocyanin
LALRLPQAGSIIVALAVMALAFGAPGCDDGSTSAGSPTPAPSAVVTQPASIVKTPDADSAITLIAHNLSFDADELRAPAGALALIIDNRDGGTPHNLHVFAGNDNTGESIADTPIENGPASASLVLQLDVGSYFFQCDVHPSMHGSLVVS